MAGYTPLYDTLLSGTLYGRWPHTGIWACLLSRVSRDGVIDETPQCLAAAIGVPVDTLMQCIHDFMQPDENSRTADHEGRRLVPIDPARSWGWKVVNHGKYREKARKQSYDSERVESGKDAERKRAARAKESASRDVPTRPAMSRDVPLSEAEANKKKEDPFALAREVSGLDCESWDRWIAYRQGLKKPIKGVSAVEAARDMAKLGTLQAEAVRHTIAKGWTGLRPPDSSSVAGEKPMFLPNGKPNPELWR